MLSQHAQYFADAILDSELCGLQGHGFYWLQFYCAHLRSGKVDGCATPVLERASDTSFRVDAANGFAHTAIKLGFDELIPAAKQYGVAALGVYHSYNAGTMGFHTGILARAGLLALGVSNAVPTVAPVGGKTPVIGTNPISLAVPGAAGQIALLIDQSATAVPWTSVQLAADEGKPIPLGWALNSQGEPTTDARAGLAGSMVPAGGVKGFNVGLIVEILCAALAGGSLGVDMGSFTDDDGRFVDNGQFFVAFDPARFSGAHFAKTIDKLARSIVEQEGARLPNAQREANRIRLGREGFCIEMDLYQKLLQLAK